MKLNRGRTDSRDIQLLIYFIPRVSTNRAAVLGILVDEVGRLVCGLLYTTLARTWTT